MKKVIIGALALFAMASCSKSELVDENRNSNMIEFGAVANSLSRATTVYNNSNLDKFTVWASFDGETFIDGDVIEKQGGKWVNTTTTRYWPAGCADGKKVTFIAHANGGDRFEFISGMGWSTFNDYEVSTDIAQQKDLLIASVKASSGPVNLEFKHALSQIVFNAKCTNKNLRVVIDGVSIGNIGSKNTALFTPPHLTWNQIMQADRTTKYSVAFDAVTIDSLADSQPVALTSAGSANALLLHPHADAMTKAWNPATETLAETGGTYFLVKCAIANVAGGSETMLWGTNNGDGTYTTAEIAIPVSFLWDQNRQYVYTLVFGEGAGGINPDTGNPILTPVAWEDVTVKDFEPQPNVDFDME